MSLNESEILELAAALKGCTKCDYDEAEGALLCHCKACQHKVTSLAWEIVHRRHAQTRARVTEEMVTRFLSWKLPADFAPDCHITFKLPDPALNPNPSWPVGTNLLTAEQARAMLQHVLGEGT
jgi:hypothetical protein